MVYFVVLVVEDGLTSYNNGEYTLQYYLFIYLLTVINISNSKITFIPVANGGIFCTFNIWDRVYYTCTYGPGITWVVII